MSIYIIGEMAWTHMGDIEVAIRLLKGLKASGADAVGIHITHLESMLTRNYKCVAGQTLSDSADDSESIFNYLDKINTSEEDWLKFNEVAKEIGMDIVAMCNDIPSFEFSKKLSVKKYVIPPTSFVEFDFIKKITAHCDDIILRIGGATIDEIDRVVNFISDNNPAARINLLAGIQLYPTPIDQLHFRSIPTLKQRYAGKNVTIGTADHIAGDHPYAIYLTGLAVPYGVEVIEKHVTTDFNEKREDYEAAIGIDHFKTFVDYIRSAEIALGESSLDYLNNFDFEKYRSIVRKKIVAKKPLEKGTILLEEHLAFKRSDFGEQLDRLENIIGKKLLKPLNTDDGITLTDVE